MFVGSVIEVEASRSDGEDKPGKTRKFHSANELFDIMARSHNFQPDEENRLTPRDLVILYENLDLGNRLMSRATELNTKKPNQHVENIVSKDCDSDSEDSDLCSTEDVLNLLIISNERINQMKNSSAESTFRQKFSESNTKAINSNFGYKNQGLSDQFKVTNDIFAIPPSLFDYLRNKGNDSNCELYMDNIIRHVQHTIDQLKRISNGEYLTDKVKEKWLETRKDMESVENNKDNIIEVPAKLPITLENKSSKFEFSWSDIMRSELDLRRIYKLLDKKAYMQMPTMISGKICNDNLVIGFERRSSTALREKSDKKKRIQVVFNLSKSEQGLIVKNINSITVLQEQDTIENKLPPLTCKYENTDENKDDTDNVSKLSSIGKESKRDDEELQEKAQDDDNKFLTDLTDETVENNLMQHELTNTAEISRLNEIKSNDHDFDLEPYSYFQTNVSNANTDERRGMVIIISETSSEILDNDGASRKSHELSSNDHDSYTETLNIPIPLPEEIPENLLRDMKKNKSPKKGKPNYENMYNEAQEKRTKKLLEIKERRERKRRELMENYKLKKAKHSVPQSSNSVTKLSITNKAFYNSIYGQGRLCHIGSTNTTKMKIHSPNFSNSNLIIYSESDSEFDASYTNKYNVVDKIYNDLQTELSNIVSESTHVTVDNNAEPNVLSSNSVYVKESRKTASTDTSTPKLVKNVQSRYERRTQKKNVVTSPTKFIAKTDKSNPKTSNVYKSLSVRENIDKIYNLMRSNAKQSANMTTLGNEKNNAPYSDSGTSVKHNRDLEDPSNFSFDKPLSEEVSITQKTSVAIEPKVIITAKVQKKVTNEDEKMKKKTPLKIDNPLKAITQLLHDIDHVQKTRSKSSEKNSTFLNSNKSTRATATSQQNLKENVIYVDKTKAKKLKWEQPHVTTSTTNINTRTSPKGQPASVAKNALRVPKKKVADIVDELKEAKGEAVRGPSFWNPRLNSLAQPRKAYVQATIEQCEARYSGKKFIPQKLQRMIDSYSYQNKKRDVSPMKKSKFGYERTAKDESVKKLPLSPERQAKIIRLQETPTKENTQNRVRKTTEPKRRPFSGEAHAKLAMMANKVVQDESQKRQTQQSVFERDGKPRSARSNESTLSKNDNKFEAEKYFVERSRKMAAVESYVQNHYQQSAATQKRKVVSIDMKLSTISAKNVEQTMSLSSVSEENGVGEINQSYTKNIVGYTKSIEYINNNKGHFVVINKSISEETLSNIDDLSEGGNPKKSINTYENYSSFAINREKENFRIEEVENLESNQKNDNLKQQLLTGFFPKSMINMTSKSKGSIHRFILLQPKKINSLVKSTSYHFFNSEPQKLFNWKVAELPVQISSYARSMCAVEKISAKTEINNSLRLKPSQKLSDLVWPLRESAGQIFYKNQNLKYFGQTVEDKPTSKNNELVIYLKGESLNQQTKERARRDNLFTEEKKSENIDKNMETEKQTNDGFQNQIIHSLDNKNEACHTNQKSDGILNSTAEAENNKAEQQTSEYTSSLDILAELLDEIQKITVCQTQIANSKTDIKYQKDPKVVEESREIISIAPVDQLRYVGSSSSIILNGILGETENTTKENVTSSEVILLDDALNKGASFINNNVEKKIHAGIQTSVSVVNTFGNDTAKEHCNEKPFETKLDVPLCIDVQSEESLNKKKKELSEKIKFEEKELSTDFYKYSDKEVNVELINKLDKATNKPSKDPLNVDDTFIISNSAIGILSKPSYTEDLDESESAPLVTKSENKLKTGELLIYSQEKKKDIITIKEFVNSNKNSSEDKKHNVSKMVPKLCGKIDAEDADLHEKDSQFQMKRDILVTVYSILVFTVFAALSFPEMMYTK